MAALANGNDTVGVNDARGRSRSEQLRQHRHDASEQLAHSHDVEVRSALTAWITITVSLPFTSAATITGAITITSTSGHQLPETGN